MKNILWFVYDENCDEILFHRLDADKINKSRPIVCMSWKEIYRPNDMSNVPVKWPSYFGQILQELYYQLNPDKGCAWNYWLAPNKGFEPGLYCNHGKMFLTWVYPIHRK